MSFIDLTASDVWSEADIATRVRALIRTNVSEEAELKAARLARKSSRTAAEQAYIDAVDAAVDAALAEGAQAREDMALLAAVLAVEAGEAGVETLTPTALEVYRSRELPDQQMASVGVSDA